MVALTVHPPKECSEDEAEVHVTQRSTGEVAIVESASTRTPPAPAATPSDAR